MFVAGHEITVDDAGTVSAVRTYEHQGEVVATRSTDEGLTWIGRTHQGTAAWAIAAGAMTVAYRRYDPFGNKRGTSVREWTSTQSGYHTGVEDPTGLISMGARFYDPAVGRFISRDPVIDFRSSQQPNGYIYAGNNPMTWTDSSGLNWLTDKWNQAKNWASKTYNRAKTWVGDTYHRVKRSVVRTYHRVKNYVVRKVKQAVSAVVSTVRSVASTVGSWMYRKTPSVESWAGRRAAASNANGGKRSISIPGTNPIGVPPVSKPKPLWQIEYRVPTTAEQSKILGAGYAALAKVTGGSCSTNQGMSTCQQNVPISLRGGTTVGDTFTSKDPISGHSTTLMNHEKFHRDNQWRKYGVSFAAPYLWDEAASQLMLVGLGINPADTPCTFNRYEHAADDHGGQTGYERVGSGKC
ncbi:hypothetical protein GCM10029992_35840 [Glycomyces albus]